MLINPITMLIYAPSCCLFCDLPLEELQQAAGMFGANARKLKNKLWWKDMKVYFLLHSLLYPYHLLFPIDLRLAIFMVYILKTLW